MATANDITNEATQLVKYFQDLVPTLISYGIRVLLALIFFFIGRIVIRWIRKIVKGHMERVHVDAGVQHFADSFLRIALYILLIVLIAAKLGVETSSIAALIASTGVAIGLALQGSLANFAGGILILLLRPFGVGDYIVESAGGNEGVVKEVSLIYTKLLTVDNRTVVLPNGVLSNNSLINVTARPERQLDLRVKVAYQADLRQAKDILTEVLRKNPKILQELGTSVFVDGLEDTVILGLRGWVKTEDYGTVRWQVLEDIKVAFGAAGIISSFSQMTVHVDQVQADLK